MLAPLYGIEATDNCRVDQDGARKLCPDWEKVYDRDMLKGLELTLKLPVKGRKLTDVIHDYVPENRLLMSKKCVDLIRQFKVADHEFIPATVIQKGVENPDYSLFCCHSNLTDYVDFAATQFYLSHDKGQDLVRVSSTAEWKSMSRRPFPSTIVLKSDFDQELDLFRIGEISDDLYVSARLHQALQQARISGIRLWETGKVRLSV